MILDVPHTGESPDPSDRTTGPASAALPPLKTEGSSRERDDHYVGVVAVLSPKLRLIRGSCNLQWVIQRFDRVRDGVSTWQSFAFCQTREGVISRLKDMLIEERLSKRGQFSPRQEQARDAKGRTVGRKVVTREMLAETEAARARLAAGDVASFGIEPAAWAAIAALPPSSPRIPAHEAQDAPRR